MTATATLPPGTLVIAGRQLGRIVKDARIGPADGYNVATTPDAHAGSAPHFYALDAVRVAVLGVNVCRTPLGGCWCGLVHIGRPEQLNTN
jgi:hypothetical protein